jgi:L-fuconate dehydratase
MSDTIQRVRAIDQRYTLPPGAGSDAMHPDPQYSYAVTLVDLGNGVFGTGLSFSLGRGNELVVKAIEALVSFVVGRSLSEIMPSFARFWRGLADESQLRWLGPQKGATHMALASVSMALLDAWALCQGKPLWQLLLDMPPEALIDWIDLTYLDDFLTRDEALELLRAKRPSSEARDALLARGYPAYNTAVGWIAYDLDEVVRLCHRQVEAGFRALKIKVGSDTIQEDVRRVAAVREAVGPDIQIMLDANQRWSVAEAVAAGRALAPFACYWLEEPTHPDDLLGYQHIARAVHPLPLASGECVANAVLFKNLIGAGAIQYVQADMLRLGGLPEFLAVALMARKAGLPVVPHASDMGQVHQHLVLWQALALGVEPTFLEYIPHLRDHFVTPAVVEQGRFHAPRTPGISSRLVGLTP